MTPGPGNISRSASVSGSATAASWAARCSSARRARFADRPAMDAFLIPGGLGLRQGRDHLGMEMGSHLLRRAGYAEELIEEVARVMEYSQAYQLYRDDVEMLPPAVTG